MDVCSMGGRSVEEPVPNLHSFMFDDNYPNPLSLVTTIPFVIPRPGEVTLDIIDITGRHEILLMLHIWLPGFILHT